MYIQMLGFDGQEVKGSSQGRPAWLLWPTVVAENGGPSEGKPPRGHHFRWLSQRSAGLQGRRVGGVGSKTHKHFLLNKKYILGKIQNFRFLKEPLFEKRGTHHF